MSLGRSLDAHKVLLPVPDLYEVLHTMSHHAVFDQCSQPGLQIESKGYRVSGTDTVSSSLEEDVGSIGVTVGCVPHVVHGHTAVP